MKGAITGFDAGSAAPAAGLKTGDVVERIGEDPIDHPVSRVRAEHQRVAVVFSREGKQMTRDVQAEMICVGEDL